MSSPGRFPAPGQPAALVWLSLFVAGVTAAEAALGPVGFGSTGDSLLLFVSTLTFAAAAGVLFLLAPGSRARLLALACMAGAAIAMHVVDPTGPVLGLFLVAALTAVTGRLVAATTVLVTAVIAYNVVQLAVGGESLVITIATDAGSAFFYLVGVLAQRERAQREEVSRLLERLEAGRAAEREATRLAERAALAREVHDVLAHVMSGLVIRLAGARLLARTTAADAALVDALDEAHQLGKEGLDESRRAVRMLRGEDLPGFDAIDHLLVQHASSTGSAVDWKEIGTAPEGLPSQVGLTAYRWVQETLSNVRKHAPTATPTLELRWDRDGLTLSSRNELASSGSGSGAHPGYGLQGMAERAHALGGTFDIEHSESAFRTVMRLPLRVGPAPSPEDPRGDQMPQHERPTP